MYQPIKFFLFALAFMGLLTSCQKEQPDLASQNAKKQNAEWTQQSENKTKILHFIDKLQRDEQSSGIGDRDAPLTIDEMAFGTEAVLNLYYTRLDDQFKQMDYAEVNVTVPVSGGVVDDSDLSNAYNSIEQAVEDHLNAVGYADKKVGYVDVIVSDVTGNEATLRVKTAVGDLEVEPSDPPPGAQPPYFIDGWRCGKFTDNNTPIQAIGKCDGTSPNWDAAKLFKKTLNEHYRKDHPFPLPYQGVYAFQVNSDATIFLFDAEPSSNKFFKAPYLGQGNLSNLCISESDMNLYYGNYEDEITLMETTPWQLAHQYLLPIQQAGEFGWKFKWVESLEASKIPEDGIDMVKHIAKLLLMKQIIINNDDGGDNYTGSLSSSKDPATWVKGLLD